MATIYDIQFSIESDVYNPATL